MRIGTLTSILVTAAAASGLENTHPTNSPNETPLIDARIYTNTKNRNLSA